MFNFRLVHTPERLETLKTWKYPTFAVEEQGDSKVKTHYHITVKFDCGINAARKRIKDEFKCDGQKDYGGFIEFDESKKAEWLRYCSKGAIGHYGDHEKMDVRVIRNDLFPDYDAKQCWTDYHVANAPQRESALAKRKWIVVTSDENPIKPKKSKAWTFNCATKFFEMYPEDDPRTQAMDWNEILDFVSAHAAAELKPFDDKNHSACANLIWYKINPRDNGAYWTQRCRAKYGPPPGPTVPRIHPDRGYVAVPRTANFYDTAML